jgi:hypothetical protein
MTRIRSRQESNSGRPSVPLRAQPLGCSPVLDPTFYPTCASTMLELDAYWLQCTQETLSIYFSILRVLSINY